MKKEKVFTLGYSVYLNGKPTHFKQKIRDRIKTCTIRLPRKDGKLPKPGQILRKYMSLRTKQYEPVFDWEGVKGEPEIEPRCINVWPIEIVRSNNEIQLSSVFFKDFLIANGGYMSRPGNFLYWNAAEKYKKDRDLLNKFAIMDGWNNFEEMLSFFNKSFSGNLIHWGWNNG